MVDFINDIPETLAYGAAFSDTDKELIREVIREINAEKAFDFYDEPYITQTGLDRWEDGPARDAEARYCNTGRMW